MNTQAQRIEAIDALLPQTQCGKCGHPSCQPYAQGIAQGEAINKCPPGGLATIEALARLLGVPVIEPEQAPVAPQIAFIREAECIGCTKCIQACPTDAIVGAAKLMHTVIRDECSGCELCLAPCPVDCIDLLPLAPAEAAAQRARAGHFRRRFDARQQRLQRRRQAERAARMQPTLTAPALPSAPPGGADARVKHLKIEAAMAQATLAKAAKRFGAQPTAQQQAQLAELRRAAEQAQAELASLQGQAPLALDAMSMKKARIALATRRVELKSAERNGADEATLTRLRQALEAAERALGGAS
jgi:electron transport complex protein RnfB